MPLYEFKCPNCGHVFDKIQHSGLHAPECPQCGKWTERRFTPIAVNMGQPYHGYAQMSREEYAAASARR